jgi:serine/threonine protein kinase
VSSHYEAFGKYVLLEKLATGGMAEVFLARGMGTAGIGKFFAIKRILPQYADSPEFIEMFKDEAKIAINLNHSNIVSIHEFGVEKGQFFLVMDYVEGRNMRQILNKMKKSALNFTLDQIVFMIKEVAAGLDHAHRCIDGSTGRPLNITHRDMSPQNIMVSFEGEVKIVDFGIAKAESQLETTRAGTLKGKFGYMSPEQAEGQPVDLRTDIFSLGIVMWELLANDRLFVANNEINTLRKIRDCQIPSLRKINPNIHSELERIVQKALARDRNLRYQTGAALHRDLNRFLNRQYPDFSAQDFSVFVKSVFSDEILSLRKRLVEYTKVNLTPSQINANPMKNGKEPDDRTALLDTNTSSLVASESIIVSKEDSSLVRVTNPGKTMTTSLRIEEDEMTRTDSDAREKLDEQLRAQQKTPLAAGLLDEAALAAEMSQQRQVHGNAKLMPLTPMKTPPVPENSGPIAIPNMPGPLETEDVSTSPSIRTNARINRPGTRTNIRPLPKAQPARFATFLVFMLLCVSVYSYLAKYFSGMMCDVIATTHPFISPLHNALGVQPCGREVAAQVHPTQARPVGNSQLENFLTDSPNALVITSNPSGAEIWLNNQPTGLITPSKVEIPPDDTFSIVLRKRGYTDYKRLQATRESIGHKIDATLQKMNTGYVDIEIFPPQEAVVFVNGRQINMNKTIARDIIVPANQPVKIRAENHSNKSFEEVTVTVPMDRKQLIKLNPRKNTRLPSNAPNQ